MSSERTQQYTVSEHTAPQTEPNITVKTWKIVSNVQCKCSELKYVSELAEFLLGF